MTFQPDLMRFKNGDSVSDAADWEKRRLELLDILWKEEYGYPPTPPENVSAEITGIDKGCAAGHARLESIDLSFQAEKGRFTFPIKFFVPNDGKQHPTIVLINFRPDPYDKYFPIEEILNNGFALALVCYKDITADDGDFTEKLAGLYTRPDDGAGWGKLSLWAFGVSRVIDYLQTREEVDVDNIAVAGHSRLGKTALLCAAQDERVKFALVNDSGCGGAALEQTKHAGGETIRSMSQHFPYWFCENRSRYADNTGNMPFDQHFLIAAIAPRYVAIGSASLDTWADPYSEQLSAVAASAAWEIYHLRGLIAPAGPAANGAVYNEGSISYHLRDGIHFFGRGDWLNYMAFMKQHLRSEPMRLLFAVDTKDYDPNGVAFIRPSARCIHIKNGLIAMVHSIKYDYYKFPGGGIEKGESNKEALIRETREEAGLVVIPASIREYGYVHRVQASDRDDTDYFVQDNYYYLCDVEEGLQSQRLDDYEAEEQFTLEYVDPDRAIFVNRTVNHGPKNPIMIEREARVLEFLKEEGYLH